MLYSFKYFHNVLVSFFWFILTFIELYSGYTLIRSQSSWFWHLFFISTCGLSWRNSTDHMLYLHGILIFYVHKGTLCTCFGWIEVEKPKFKASVSISHCFESIFSGWSNSKRKFLKYPTNKKNPNIILW